MGLLQPRHNQQTGMAKHPLKLLRAFASSSRKAAYDKHAVGLSSTDEFLSGGIPQRPRDTNTSGCRLNPRTMHVC